MNQFSDIISQLQSKEVLDTLSKKSGLNQAQTLDIVKSSLPTLMEALGENASNAEKAKGLAKALDNHGADNISDLSGFLKGIDSNDAGKMLSHILSGQKSGVENSLASKNNVNPLQVTSIMSMLAPILMGMLGNQKKQGNLNMEDITNLTKKSSDGSMMDLMVKFFDKDKDGSIMDEAGDFLSNFLKKK